MKVDLLTKPFSNFKRFFENGTLIDSGPLMLIFYREFDKKYNSDFLKKISYDKIDYTALTLFINGLPGRLIITPNIFHELYNHAQKHFDNRLREFFNVCFDKLIGMEEMPVKKNDMLNHDLFIELEIGEHSLICACGTEPHAIIHGEERGIIDGKLRQNKDILTISIKNDILPWYYAMYG